MTLGVIIQIFARKNSQYGEKNSVQKKINNKEETTVTGKSRTTAGRGIIIGNSSADTPTIIRILKILLPMTLPKAIDDVPFTAEAKLTKNSGADGQDSHIR